MAEFVLMSKRELTDLVLAEVRARSDCLGVNDVVIVETKNPRSVYNWEICIIAAGSGDPTAVQRAGAEVQRALQPLYRLK